MSRTDSETERANRAVLLDMLKEAEASTEYITGRALQICEEELASAHRRMKYAQERIPAHHERIRALKSLLGVES